MCLKSSALHLIVNYMTLLSLNRNTKNNLKGKGVILCHTVLNQ